MRKKICFLLLTTALLLMMVVPVYASEYTFVYDEAFLLTTPMVQQLEDTAADISVEYGCGVYIVTVYDYTDYGNSVRNAAENFFLSHDLGLGSDANGVLLFLSMAERDYALIAHGNLGNRAFTDYGKELLCEAFLDDFRYDSWAAGFKDYLSGCEEFLYAQATGMAVDVGRHNGGPDPDTGLTLVMLLLVPALIAGVSCGVMAASMKTAKERKNADGYIQNRGIELTGRHDRFLTRTVVRQKIESSSSSGGIRVNSGGFSGRSGKF